MGSRAKGSVAKSVDHTPTMDIDDEDKVELGLENLEDFEKEPID